MTVAPAVVVEQPFLIPPTISLVNAAIDATPDGERWINGFQYSPEACVGGQAFSLQDCDPDYSTAVKLTADSGAPITGTPYGIHAQDTCSTFSYQWRDYVARATRLLLATESEWIASELWAPSYEPNNIGFTNAPIFYDNTPGGGPVSLSVAIALIEQAAFQTFDTWQPQIHMPPSIFTQIAGITGAGVLLTQVGNRWYTPMGSQIVVDKGYSGNGPGNDPTGQSTYKWIYATPPVQVRRGPIMVIPGEMSEAVLRRENQVTYRAERAAHASFDYHCGVVGLQVAYTSL